MLDRVLTMIPLPTLIAAVLAQCGDGWAKIVNDAPRIHLAILREPYLDMILTGRKTIESRFSKHRTLPHGRVGPGDVLILKRSSGPVVALFSVRKVLCARKSLYGFGDLYQYASKIGVDDAYIQAKAASSEYATLIWLDQLKKLEPIAVQKTDQRAWILLRGEQGGG